MEVSDTDNFIERIADAVVAKLDEREKINLIAQAVIAQLEEKAKEGQNS